MALGKLFLNTKTGEKIISNNDDPSIVFEQFVFDNPSSTWYIDHVNNTTAFNIQVVCNDEVALPDEIYVESSNRIRVEFTENRTGFCNVLFFARGFCGVDPVINPTPTPTPSTTATVLVTPTPSTTATMTPTPTIPQP